MSGFSQNSLKVLTFACWLLIGTSLFGLNPSEWKYQQTLDIASEGIIKLALPGETLDLARPDLQDLRIIGPDNAEIPFLLLRPTATGIAWKKSRGFSSKSLDDHTQVVIETGSSLPLRSLRLATVARAFDKPAGIEISSDGQQWELLAENIRVSRQDGSQQAELPLEGRVAPWIRVTISNQQSRPVAIIGAMFVETEGEASTEENQPVRILRKEEYAGETMVTLDAGTANLPLAAMEISVSDPFCNRPATLSVRELLDGEISEHILSKGSLHRLEISGMPSTANLRLPIGCTSPARELILHIANGDSPPLHIENIQLSKRPVHAVFAPQKAGRHVLLTGNRYATAPRYDLASLSTALESLSVSGLQLSAASQNSDYRQSDPLASVAAEGTHLSPLPWAYHRRIRSPASGVQQLELDLATLSGARTDLGDLRILKENVQLPYILERTSLSRQLSLQPELVADPQNPRLSRWKISLPYPGLPLKNIALTSPTALFQRKFRAYEIITNAKGVSYQQNLGKIVWTRTPGDARQTCTFDLSARLQTNTLWIETDNGDNSPIALPQVEACTPVARMLFKASSGQSLFLLYGNNQATTPRYDLGLMATPLLNAEKFPAAFDGEPLQMAISPQALTGWRKLSFLKNPRFGLWAWGFLGLAGIAGLAIAIKLLPKRPAST